MFQNFTTILKGRNSLRMPPQAPSLLTDLKNLSCIEIGKKINWVLATETRKRGESERRTYPFVLILRFGL
jgi:hypothetical protein